MKITILGTRGEIEETAPYHSKKSGVLIDDTLLFDSGDERFLATNPKALLITHLHPDHAYFVRHHEDPPSVPIYAPEGYKQAPLHITNKPFSIGSYHITPIPTIHSHTVASTAYLIEHKGIRVLYTGDMIWIEKKYHHLLTQIDLVITEASFIRKGGMVRREKEQGQVYGHTGIPNLLALFSKFTHTILLVHFGSWFYQDIAHARREIAQLGTQYNVTVIVGYDGLTLELE